MVRATLLTKGSMLMMEMTLFKVGNEQVYHYRLLFHGPVLQSVSMIRVLLNLLRSIEMIS